VSDRKVVLRPKQRTDVEDDYQWRMDPELARLDARPESRVTFEEFRRSFLDELEFPRPGWISLAIDVDGEHVGNMVAYDVVAGDSCEIGIVIGPGERRHIGIGREAVTEFLRYAWDTLGLRKVYLHTLETNEPARRSFEACGFRPVARVQRQHWMVRYEVRREWWLMEDAQARYPRSQGGTARDDDSTDGNEAVTSRRDIGRPRTT
jgi:RimJ/RimL family protein N-acetyltransferase